MKKSFFRERTVAQILKLRRTHAMRQRGLVSRIDNLDPSSEYIEIRAQMIPGRFFSMDRKTQAQASRKLFKEIFLELSHPETKSDCYNSQLIPLDIRSSDFQVFSEMREEENNFIGYFVRPNWGDRMKRVSPFAFLLEGQRLFAYAENHAGGIKVNTYDDARKVEQEGAQVVVEVPSRTVKQDRYQFRINHVPIIRSPNNLAQVLSIRPSVIHDPETGEPIKGRTAHEDFLARYTRESDLESSPMIITYPHDVAAYLAIVKQQLAVHNMTPMTMNPHALFSQHGVDIYRKIRNNVLVYDPTLKVKHKLRKTHVAESSILMARAIGEFGPDDISYWNPERDGRLKDYDWTIPGSK